VYQVVNSGLQKEPAYARSCKAKKLIAFVFKNVQDVLGYVM